MGKTFAFVPEVLTIDAAAHYLGVSKRTVEEYIAQGKIPTYKLPAAEGAGHLKRTFIRKVDADRFISEEGTRV